MTITRLWQAGAEFNNILTEFSSRSSTTAQTSNTLARTGTYSFRTDDFASAKKVLDTTYTQVRVGAFVNHNGVDSTDDPSVLQLMNGSDVTVDLRWDGDNNTLRLYLGATLVDSALSAEFAATTTWLHVGIDAKIAGSGGWVYVYLDGVEVLSYDGDTTGGGSAIDSLVIGSTRTLENWGNYIYYDDLYIDNTSGESTPVVVPDYRFVPLAPNGNGFHDDWVGNDGNSTDNYLLVDEIPPDNDTTYVESALTGEEDSYAMSSLTLETGYEVNAVIGMAVAKKLNAGGALQLKITHRTTVGGSPTFDEGAAFALSTDYGLLWRRSAARPDAGAWDETTVNALEIGVLTE
jgi:hypothetical protein